MLKAFYNSPSLRVAAAFGFGGAAFTIGNLILARVLPAQEYALVSLVIGLVSLSGLVAPLGIDQVVSRRGLQLGAYLRRTVLAASLLIAFVTAVIGAFPYNLQASLLVCLFVATAAGGISQSTSAHFQGQQQFAISVPILQAPNWAVVLAGVLTAIIGATTATFSAAILAASGLVTAAIGWLLVSQRVAEARPPVKLTGLWGEAISLMTVQAASATFLQLERLVIPNTIGIKNLAMFGVLAALVGSPFRVFQAAIGFTIVPGLRAAKTPADRRQLLRREFLLVAAVMGTAALGIWIIAPYLAHWLLAGRYELTNSLMFATLISGVLKVMSAFAAAIVSALAPEKGLRLLSVASWGCIGVATLASFAAAPWGLVGVLYAISLGWLARCLVAGWICVPHLRDSANAGII
jgi:O-antigen/teichoic acid export membrane protein